MTKQKDKLRLSIAFRLIYFGVKYRYFMIHK